MQHKQWSDKQCSNLFDQGKQAKMQGLQNQNQMNEDNVNYVIYETRRTFRNKTGNK
jgi:hypothetical protein